MNEKKLVQNFKSYINVNAKNNGEKNGALQEIKPKLLNGELVAGEAHSVVMLAPLSERERGCTGSLYVTNYKLSFLPADDVADELCGQRNTLLGTYDVPLSAVGAVYLVDGGRRRKLVPYSQEPNKVKGLQVVCKNMKVMTFSFSHSSIGQGRKVAIALLHHAFPKRHDLLFAYECKEPYYPTLPLDLNMFMRLGDWKKELERCQCPHYRISDINGTPSAFAASAGTYLVVPSSVFDYALEAHARHFRGGRLPVWVWGRAAGAALLRAGEPLPTEQAATSENVYLEQIRKSHPKLLPPHVICLCGNNYAGNTSNANALPSIATLQASFKKIVDLCTPTTLREFKVLDSQYYSILESSRWLRLVSNCLAFAEEAAMKLDNNYTVVLQEGDGVDYSAVVSTLTQLLVDPHCRTLVGFQSLLQKEWLALGHPFCDRLGLLSPPSPKDKELVSSSSTSASPVFLLMLDCVWQLLTQLPCEFQFSEIYLASLWDSCHNQLFDTFIFNCPRDRDLAVARNFTLRPVWDWGEQFSEQDISLFYNPLYASNKPQNVKRMSAGAGAGAESRLRCWSQVSRMQLWGCHERWLQPLDGRGAGDVHYHLHNRQLVAQIHRLKEKQLSISLLHEPHSKEEVTEPLARQLVTRFYPFSNSKGICTSNLDSMQVSIMDASQLLDSQSLLNAPD